MSPVCLNGPDCECYAKIAVDLRAVFLRSHEVVESGREQSMALMLEGGLQAQEQCWAAEKERDACKAWLRYHIALRAWDERAFQETRMDPHKFWRWVVENPRPLAPEVGLPASVLGERKL